jgi:hypothetical protein
MLTLQRAFKYDGDPAQAPCRSAVIQLAVPGYSYVSTIVPRIESLTVGGKLTLVASDGAVVSRSDFAYYDLSLRVQPIAGEDAAAIAERHIDWKAFKDAVDHGALPFSFAGGSPLVRSSGQSARVQIKRFDGSVVWSQELAGEPSAWNALAIEVPLVRPIKLSAARKAPERVARERQRRLTRARGPGRSGRASIAPALPTSIYSVCRHAREKSCKQRNQEEWECRTSRSRSASSITRRSPAARGSCSWP